MARKITNRNTKAEILDAYEDVLEELKHAQKELARFTPNQVPDDAPAPMPQEVDVAQALGLLKGFRVNLTDLTTTLQRRLTSEASHLQELLEEAGEHTESIKKLHEIDPDEATLEQLVARYENLSDDFERELSTRREEFEQNYARRTKEWTEERERHDLETTERDEAWKLERDRERTSYEYDLRLKRELEQEEYKKEFEHLEQELELFEENKREELGNREDAISSKERHYDELKAKVATFKEELEEAVKGAEHQGIGIARKKARTEADLAAKTHEGKMRVFDLRVEALEGTATKQLEKIQELTKQLAETQRQAQSLAVKAIEGASSASTYEAVREIAIEQAKHSQKGK